MTHYTECRECRRLELRLQDRKDDAARLRAHADREHKNHTPDDPAIASPHRMARGMGRAENFRGQADELDGQVKEIESLITEHRRVAHAPTRSRIGRKA